MRWTGRGREGGWGEWRGMASLRRNELDGLVNYGGEGKVTMSTCHPVTLSLCHPVTPSPCYPVTLSPCHPITLSPCQPFSLSPCHLVTMSPCQHVTLSPCHPVILSPCHPVTVSPCYPITMSPCHPVTLAKGKIQTSDHGYNKLPLKSKFLYWVEAQGVEYGDSDVYIVSAVSHRGPSSFQAIN